MLLLQKGCLRHLILFNFSSTINCHMELISKVVAFSVEASSPHILVFVAPEIGCSVAVFYKIRESNLEELSLFVINFSRF